MRHSSHLKSDRGSAPVEFLLVGVPLMLLAAVILQLLTAGYLRLVALDAAVEGAGTAALAGSSEARGNEQAAQVLATLLVPTEAQVSTQTEDLSGRAITVTRVAIPTTVLLTQSEVIAHGWAWSEAR